MKTQSKLVLLYLAIFAGLKIFSFFFTPPTPLLHGHMLNSALALFILSAVTYLNLHGDQRGWLIIAGEMMLGGSGGYLSIGPIALRTALLMVSLAIYFAGKLRNNSFFAEHDRKLTASMIILVLWSLASAIIGYSNSHNISLIYSDLVPYLFLLYFFPLSEIVKKNQFLMNQVKAMFIASIIGNLLFIIITLSAYSSGFLIMQDSYYHWFRDVALGKITDIKNGFFRITLNEHLLLIPAIIYSLFQIIQNNFKKIYLILLVSLLSIMSINLTRIYLVALVIGCLLILRKTNWKKSFTIFATTGLLFISIYTLIHLFTTRFNDPGWDYFGLRLSSIATPQIEDSSLSRMMLLPKIIEIISSAPIFGSGLGAMVEVYSPVFNQIINTPHFDWGYLEIIAEMGAIGLIFWLIFIRQIYFSIKKGGQLKPLYFSILASLIIINITSPALFHVLGIIMILWIASSQDRASLEQLHV